MGSMLLAGLVLAAAAVAIGLLVRAPTALSDAPAPRRNEPVSPDVRAAIVLAAFVQGIAVLGVVQALLAIFLGDVHDRTAGLLAGLPALAGGLAALAIIVRSDRPIDRRAGAIGRAYVLALGALGVVVMALAYLIEVTATASPAPDLAYIALGLLSGIAEIGVGRVGSAGIRALGGSAVWPIDGQTGRPVELQQLVARCLPFFVLGWASGVGAIVLTVV
jgi:hypothetical protein